MFSPATCRATCQFTSFWGKCWIKERSVIIPHLSGFCAHVALQCVLHALFSLFTRKIVLGKINQPITGFYCSMSFKMLESFRQWTMKYWFWCFIFKKNFVTFVFIGFPVLYFICISSNPLFCFYESFTSNHPPFATLQLDINWACFIERFVDSSPFQA